jgi:hypothetical protein
MFGENFVTDCDIVKCNAAYEHFFCVVYNILKINFCVSIKGSLMVKSKQVVQEQSVHLSIHPGESRHSYGCDDKCLINTLDLKHLPWLLPELSIEVEHKDQAMASPTKAITSFLSTPWSETCHQKAAAQALFGQQLLRCHWTYCYSSS